jgi:toxin ParE1/3/4
MRRAVVWTRAALDDLKSQVTYIARDNPAAARRVAARIRVAGDNLMDFATGSPGRVSGTYEKSVTGLPMIIAYAIELRGEAEVIVVLHVIHTARDWRVGDWPGE